MLDINLWQNIDSNKWIRLCFWNLSALWEAKFNFGFFTWIKKSFGFPTREGHRSPLNGDNRSSISTQSSTPYTNPLRPWLRTTIAKQSEFEWSKFPTAKEAKKNTVFFKRKTSNRINCIIFSYIHLHVISLKLIWNSSRFYPQILLIYLNAKFLLVFRDRQFWFHTPGIIFG